MTILVTIVDGIATIALEGRFLGDKESDDFVETIRRIINEGVIRMLIELSALEYINSMGLGALLAGFAMTKRAGGLLVFANGNGRVTTLLEITKTDTAISIFTSTEDALAVLKESGT